MGSVIQNESFNVSQPLNRAKNLMVCHTLPDTSDDETLNGVKGARCDGGEGQPEVRREAEAMEFEFDTCFSILLQIQRKRGGHFQGGKYQLVRL